MQVNICIQSIAKTLGNVLKNLYLGRVLSILHTVRLDIINELEYQLIRIVLQ